MADPFIGEIRMFCGSYAPFHWTFCQGTLLAIAGNEALFSLLGTAYGGDGRSSFGLPDMRGRIPIHRGSGPGLTPRVRGEMFGSEEVTLELSQIPEHTHTLQATTNPGTTNSPLGRVLAEGPADDLIYIEPTGTETINDFADEAVSKVGGGAAHPNLMPFLCVQFIIALQGNYPQRN